MKRQVLAVVLGAVTLMITGFVLWGLLSDSLGIVGQADNEEELRAVLREASDEDGMLFVPMQGFGTDEFLALHAEGPVATIFLRPQGTPAAMGKTMLKGFVHFLVAAGFAVWMWCSFARDRYSFARRFLFLFALGMFTAVVAHPANRIWWHYPMSFTVYALAANAVSWGATAAVMASLLRPRAQTG